MMEMYIISKVKNYFILFLKKLSMWKLTLLGYDIVEEKEIHAHYVC